MLYTRKGETTSIKHLRVVLRDRWHVAIVLGAGCAPPQWEAMLWSASP